MALAQSIYTTGGTVQAGGGIYLSRKADDELLQLCRDGQFAYVLTPRQMGKSSLMVQTAQRLEEEGVTSVIIDLTKIGTEVSAEQWYLGLLTEIDETLMFDTDIFEWWENNNKLGVTQRLTKFFEEVLLEEVTGRIAVFVDEIDTTLNLEFTDDFFIAIRYFYTARAQKENFESLSFVLIGVASPGDLIQNPTRTPFNIGKSITLSNFTLEEALPLADGLISGPTLEDMQQTKKVLRRVLKWTGGHPYLTQRVCNEIVSKQNIKCDDKTVDELVETLFFAGNKHDDNNLLFVRDMLTQRTPNKNKRVREVLMTYRAIRKGGRKIVLNEEQSLVKTHLKLSGIVCRDEEKRALCVSNSIYEKAFDEKWIREHLPSNPSTTKQISLSIVAALYSILLLLSIARRVDLDQSNRAEENPSSATRVADSNISPRAFPSRGLASGGTIDGFIDAVKTTQNINRRRWKPLKFIDFSLARLQQSLYHNQGFILQSASNYRERNRLNHQGAVLSLSFKDDGSTLASASDNGTLKLWNKNGVELATVDAHQSSINSISFSSEDILASASSDKTVKLWSLTGEKLAELKGHDGPVRSVAFNPGGDILVSASDDRTLILWDPLERKQIAMLRGHTGPVRSVAFSPDGDTIASASFDSTIRLWNKEGDTTAVLTGHKDWVNSVEFSSDNKNLVSASTDGTIKLWNRKGEEVFTILSNNKQFGSVDFGFNDGTPLRNADFSREGDFLAVTSLRGEVSLLDLKGEELSTLPRTQGSIYSVSFSPDGNTLAYANSSGSITLSERNRSEINGIRRHQGAVRRVTFSPDSNLVISASDDNTVKLWDRKGAEVITFNGHQGPVLDVSVSADGNTFASVSFDNTIRLWNREGNAINVLAGHLTPVRGISFNFDGSVLASASDDGTLKLWDRKGDELVSIQGHEKPIRSVEFSPEGNTLLTASDDGIVKKWGLDGIEIASIESHKGAVLSVSFNADGSYFASSGDDGQIKIWTMDGVNVSAFQAYEGRVRSIDFSPSGNTLASVDDNGMVKIWTVEGALLASIHGHSSPILSVSFSPDGKTIASASDDGTVKLWERDSARLLAWSCDWLSDYLLNHPEGQKAKAEGVCEGYL
ncbi:MAG: AAA-like domain-containing protein [Cyanobacteria bacterium J06649_5]